MNNREVLTFRPGSIGDCLMGKYFLEQIRTAYPELKATIAVPTRVGMVRDLLAAYPWIYVMPSNSLYSLFSSGRRDIVLTPYTGGVLPLRSKLLARLLGKKLIGFFDHSPFNRFLYTKLIPLIGRSRPPRLLECDALEAIGVPVSSSIPSFSYVPQPQVLRRLHLEKERYIVVHLFSGSDTRGLSLKRKQALIAALVTAVAVPLVITGSKKETDSLGVLPAGVCAAETTIQELAHLIDHAVATMSLDTGAAHIAAHLRKPLVVLASCVGVQWWSKDMYGSGVPVALVTRPDVCAGNHDYSGYAKCLDAIDSIEVAQQVRALVS